ncbi:MAG TPA: FecR domain-containing protein [Sphingobacteriaceae bacterium]|nr:FecR domain-containing protein [Sphingobacteriaceae bacterium]
MEKSEFLELLKRYLHNRATPEEQEFLLSYYNLFDLEPEVIALLDNKQKEEIRERMQKEIWKNIALSEKPENKLVFFTRTRMARMAAAAVILLISTAVLLHFTGKKSPEAVQVVKAVERTEHRLIRLPDGSTVIVNKGSRLNYPSSFDGKNKREVYLEGQAYFDVKHNASKPFIVHTGNLETTVLGTAFNIKAWPADADITVTVTRGKVQVDDNHKLLGVILPNEQITYNKPRESANQKTVENQSYLTWKDQDILFDDVTVADAAELLEERFKVSILFKDEQSRSKRFTTIFHKEESLDQVLVSICEFNNAAYSYNKEKGTVVISSNDKLNN